VAVYTEIGEDELEAFVAGYDLGKVLSFKGIAEGVENSNYLLVTDSGPFILTLYEKRVEESDLPFFLGLMNHLSARGERCPTAVADRDGRLHSRLADRPAAIITFLQGVWIRRPRRQHCTAVGAALARLHLAAADFEVRRRNALALDGWARLVAATADHADDVRVGLAEDIADEMEHLRARWPSGLPQGVIHADLFPDNVFFLGEELSGLIDFYFACNDMFAYDLAICLNAWCFEADRSFNVTKGKALLDGYAAVRPLGQEEIEALPLLARGAAFRFLLTRLNDWLSVPEGALVVPKDPMEFHARLRFHRDAESAAAYGFSL